jgi:TP901 family phage tail tape measure protein
VAESIGRAVFDLELNDGAFRAGLRQSQESIETFTDSSGRLRDEFGRYVKQQDAANTALGGFNQQLGATSGIKNLTSQIGSLVAQLGTIAVAAQAFNQIKQADDAAAAVRTLGVDAVALNDNLKLVSAGLKANISTVELTKAAYDVASAGFNNAADATEVLKASALGAKGGFSSIQVVADGATSVLNAYGLSAKEATRIVDGFITTQNDGKIVVGQYADRIGTIAPIAAAAGVSIEELNAAISAATAQGVPVEATFAGLRQVLSSILKPTQEASELAGRLGLQFNGASLQAKGLGAFLQEVAAATKGSATANNVLFGSVEALTAIQPLLNDQLVSYNQFLDNQKSSAGAAASAADLTSKTISSGVEAIGNAFSNLVTSSNFSSIGVSLSGIAEAINGISLTPAQQELTALESSIKTIQQEIDRQKEYGLDTTLAENRLKELERRANVVRSVIGQQTNVESLKTEAVGLGKQAEALKRAGLNGEQLNAQLGAIANEVAALEGRDISFNLPDGTQLVGTLTPALKQYGEELDAAEAKLGQLQTEKSLAAPGVDTTALDASIQDVEKQVSGIKANIKLEAKTASVDFEIKRIKGELNKPVGRFVDSIFGGQATKQYQEQLKSLENQRAVLTQIGAKNKTNTAEAQAKNKQEQAAQKQANKEAEVAAEVAKQKEVALRNEKLTTLGTEKANLKNQEARLGFYSKEVSLVGQINSVRAQGAIARSDTIKSLLDQELAQAQKLVATDGQRRQLELQYGQAKFNQTVAEFDLKAKALVTEQASQRASLAFEQQKAAAAGKRAEIEAQIALLQAQAANSEKGTPESERQVVLAKENLDLIREQNNQEQALGGLRSQLLGEQQAAAREQLEQQRLLALNGQAENGTLEQQRQLQADVNKELENRAGYADAAAVSATNFREQLQGASEARGDLSTAFQAQVNTVIDGSQQFSQMNTTLSQIATNTSKPPTVNVTVNNSAAGRGNSTGAVVSGTSR